MISKPMTLKEFSSYLVKLPKNLDKEITKGIQIGAKRAVGVAIRAGDKAPPASDHGKQGAFNTGAYRRGWRSENTTDGAIIANHVPYADVIEGGRHAGAKAPPQKALIPWIQKKLGLSAKEAKMAAFPIARAIARRGLKARNVLADASPMIIKVVLDEVKQAVAKALRGGK
jgi:hypothetical protein